MKNLTQITENYMQAIRDLINSKVRKYQEPTKKYNTFSEYIKHKLFLSSDEDWGFLCACMDLVGDTNLAIENFIRFEIEGPTRYNDMGEKYLRLYGFLNATYMQQNAVLTLCEIFKILKTEKDKIFNLKIREIRNKLASHSNSYRKDKNSKKDAIFLTRMSLSRKNVSYGFGNRSDFEELNLATLLDAHTKVLNDILDIILEKSITLIYKTNKNLKKKYSERLEDLRQEKKGNLVIKISKNKKILVKRYGN